MTTRDLESSTGKFAEALLGRKLTPSLGGTGATKGIASGGQRRALRSSSNRRKRSKGGKMAGDGNMSSASDMDHDHDHDHDDDRQRHDDDDDDWYYHKHGAKSGKSGKGDKYDDDDNWGREELFYLLPTACPNECVSSHVSGESYEFTDSLKECKHDEDSQKWLVKSDGSYVMIESYHDRGRCIAVDYEAGDSQDMLAKTCFNGEVVLKDCDDDYGVEWYFTGGQLVNSLCWGAGLSSFMGVFFVNNDDDVGGDDGVGGDDDAVVRECQKDVAVFGANEVGLVKADTFMFVSRLPDTPFVIEDADASIEVNDVEGESRR